MTDESLPTKQQRNMGAVSALMLVLGVLALWYGTSGLYQTRELFSWYTLLIVGGLILSVGSLVRFIKLYKVVPRPSAKADIMYGLAYSAVGVGFISWRLAASLTTNEDWDRWMTPGVFFLGGIFLLGRGLYKRSQEGSAEDPATDSPDAAPEPTVDLEATNPTPAEDE
jgi:hypothetical protein